MIKLLVYENLLLFMLIECRKVQGIFENLRNFRSFLDDLRNSL